MRIRDRFNELAVWNRATLVVLTLLLIGTTTALTVREFARAPHAIETRPGKFPVSVKCYNCRRRFNVWFNKGTVVGSIDWKADCEHCGVANYGTAR